MLIVKTKTFFGDALPMGWHLRKHYYKPTLKWFDRATGNESPAQPGNDL
jgi:hypothetical protein